MPKVGRPPREYPKLPITVRVEPEVRTKWIKHCKDSPKSQAGVFTDIVEELPEPKEEQ